jgi:hypothetical protein
MEPIPRWKRPAHACDSSRSAMCTAWRAADCRREDRGARINTRERAVTLAVTASGARSLRTACCLPGAAPAAATASSSCAGRAPPPQTMVTHNVHAGEGKQRGWVPAAPAAPAIAPVAPAGEHQIRTHPQLVHGQHLRVARLAPAVRPTPSNHGAVGMALQPAGGQAYGVDAGLPRGVSILNFLTRLGVISAKTGLIKMEMPCLPAYAGGSEARHLSSCCYGRHTAGAAAFLCLPVSPQAAKAGRVMQAGNLSQCASKVRISCRAVHCAVPSRP